MTTNLMNSTVYGRDLRDYYSRLDVQLDIFLDLICQRLPLDVTREEKLQSAYQYITQCIEKEAFFADNEAKLYAFGSRAIHTVVKPLHRKEFDLDFAIQIEVKNINFTPEEFVNYLYNCLNRNGNFQGRLKKIRYGVRVIYAGNFHVDIMLGVLLDDGRLKVPDWKDNKWVNRNPKGFISWYESKYLENYKDIQLFSHYERCFPEKLNRYIKLKAETEQIEPAIVYQDIQPIQRITQLVKRHCVIYFDKNMPDYKTSSIVLTTLIGDIYTRETAIYDGMNRFISGIFTLFEENDYAPFRLVNPADRGLPSSQQENLTDKWERDGKFYKAFRSYMKKLQRDWGELHHKKSIKDKAIFLQTIFGENIVNAAYDALNERFKEVGLSYDENGLPSLPVVNTSPQHALALGSKNRKPYFNG